MRSSHSSEHQGVEHGRPSAQIYMAYLNDSRCRVFSLAAPASFFAVIDGQSGKAGVRNVSAGNRYTSVVTTIIGPFTGLFMKLSTGLPPYHRGVHAGVRNVAFLGRRRGRASVSELNGRWFERESGEALVDPAGERPGTGAEELQSGGEQDGADDYCVEEDCDGECESEELEDVVVAGGEGSEDDDHDRRGGGDHAPRARKTVSDCGGVVGSMDPFLVDAGDEEDLVVHGEAEDDCECDHGEECLDR